MKSSNSSSVFSEFAAESAGRSAPAGRVVVAAARSWLGAPFRAQGRDRLGCDCIGLILGVGREVGAVSAMAAAAGSAGERQQGRERWRRLAAFDHATYDIHRDSGLLNGAMRHFLVKWISAAGKEIGAAAEVAPGDLALFQLGWRHWHIGIISAVQRRAGLNGEIEGMIHACLKSGMVVEERPRFGSRLCGLYNYAHAGV